MSDGGTELQRWYRIHRAAVEAGNADDATYALERITRLNQAANLQEQNAVEQATPDVSAPVAAVAGALHGASMGTGELVRGVNEALDEAARRGGLRTQTLPEFGQALRAGFEQGTGTYREAMGGIESAQPLATAAGSVGGALLLPGAGAARAFEVARAARIAGRASPVFRALAPAVAEGATLGGLSGFSSGGETLPERAQAAGESGLLGAVAGGLGGTLGLRSGTRSGREVLVARRQAASARLMEARAANAGRRAVPPPKPPTQEELLARIQAHGRAAGQAESARLGISRLRSVPGVTAAEERAISQAPAIEPPAPDLPIPTQAGGAPPSTLRPGETAQQIGPHGYEVTGTRATPAIPPDQPTLAELTAPSYRDIPPRPYPATPADQGRVAQAEATVQQQMAAGERGPRGGALVGSQATVPDARILALAQRIRSLPTAQLQTELQNPMVEDFVKVATQKELLRRGGGLTMEQAVGQRLARAGNTATAPGQPLVRLMETLQQDPTPELVAGFRRELRRASPSTKGGITAYLRTHPPQAGWESVLQDAGVLPAGAGGPAASVPFSGGAAPPKQIALPVSGTMPKFTWDVADLEGRLVKRFRTDTELNHWLTRYGYQPKPGGNPMLERP